MSVSHSTYHSFGWKSYQIIRKKAMEQELSWSGLMISLSIAFFIVVGCAFTLRIIGDAFEQSRLSPAPAQNERVLDMSNLV